MSTMAIVFSLPVGSISLLKPTMNGPTVENPSRRFSEAIVPANEGTFATGSVVGSARRSTRSPVLLVGSFRV
jgi:hypothetical protein